MPTPTDLKAITAADAYAEATAVIASPQEMVFHHKELRRILAGLMAGINRSPCFAKAMRTGCETFVLLETDPAAPKAIDAWASESVSNPECDHSIDKVTQAIEIASQWTGRRAAKAQRVAIGAE